MPAPSYDVLYDLEGQLEGPFAAILKANGLANVYTSRDDDQIQTPAVVVRAVVQGLAPNPQWKMMGTPQRQIPISFEAMLIAEVITGRRNPDAPQHGAIRGRVRYLFSAAANLILSSNFPYLQIVQILPQGGTPKITDDKELDRSEIHHSVKFAIRDDAWPAT